MDTRLRNIILKATGANELFAGRTIQSLWNGYGSIDRYGLIGAEQDDAPPLGPVMLQGKDETLEVDVSGSPLLVVMFKVKTLFPLLNPQVYRLDRGFG